jgi:hypothetical protein
MKTKFFITCIAIAVTGCFLSGCDEEVKKDAVEKYIYVNKTSLDMFYGDKVQLKANPAGETFEWTSADPAVATVTSDGTVEAVGVGLTEITVGQGTSQTQVPVTVTVPTVDKTVVAGENGEDGRFQIAVQTLSERIATARIIWNNNRDSVDIAVNNRIGVFTQTVDYSGENGYIFYVVGFDKFGNRSVSSETTATLLRNRDISSAQADDGMLTVQWGSNVTFVDHCKLSYINQAGQTASRKVFPSETTTVIDDYSSGLSYTTLFTLISPTTDTFRVETLIPTVIKTPKKLSNDGWTAASRNGNHSWGANDGRPEAIFDGNVVTGWHSTVGSPLPQCLVIDMKHTFSVHHVIMYLPTNTGWRYMNNVEIYLSDTPITPDVPQPSWGAPAAKVTYTGGDSFTVELPSIPSGQYIALVFLDSKSNTYINLMDFEVFGY